ncbi:MAG TPA: DUF255 domain-containing protein, partial [Thermoanaerobaculia bacterium]|nr:DUF255 domain-containing protein [Thermoanaerobaculia bacterium]
MRRVTQPVVLAALLLAETLAAAAASVEVPSPIAWRSYAPEVFAKARREKRLVLLDLEAVWCHWCHVMEKTTYRDPGVVKIVADRYLAVRADQDASPDLAARYGDWGWPATILFDASGKEIAKRRGYVAPAAMASMLEAFAEDATPGPSAAEPVRRFGSSTALSVVQRKALSGAHVEGYDDEHRGWGFSHKYVDADDAEWSLVLAASGDAAAEKRLRETLEAAESLLDPVWGGVYQYSAGGDWKEPHFEKIVSMQAASLRAYSLAYTALHEPRYLSAA